MKRQNPLEYFWPTNEINMDSKPEKNFVPKGAFAFFILLVLLSLAFWYGIYWLMIERT
jgi:hypothetical protein